MKKATFKRIIAYVICCVFCFLISFSATFIVNESSHLCVGDNCQICHELHTCVTNISTVAVVAAVFISSMAIFNAVLQFGKYCSNIYKNSTLVTLKVKLSS